MTKNLVNNSTHIYKVNPLTGDQEHDSVPQNDTRFALLANFFTSNGLKGEVLCSLHPVGRHEKIL